MNQADRVKTRTYQVKLKLGWFASIFVDWKRHKVPIFIKINQCKGTRLTNVHMGAFLKLTRGVSIMKRWMGIVLVWVFAAAGAHAADDVFAGLKTRLTADGFETLQLSELYSRPDVRFDAKSVSLFFVHSEGKLNYDQFASEKAIQNAQRYQAVHGARLQSAQQVYGVDHEVITGILLVETRLGTYVGKSYVFSTLSTMAALSEPAVRERLWRNIPASRRISRQRFDQKADKKSGWAYNELKALLVYCDREGKDPTSIRGSYAGAIGICQFMPSNIDKYAQDGNGDGRIDLFDHDDAIASVANYLKKHGWHPGIDDKKAYKVILRYNYSSYYANTILKVAALLKG